LINIIKVSRGLNFLPGVKSIDYEPGYSDSATVEDASTSLVITITLKFWMRLFYKKEVEKSANDIVKENSGDDEYYLYINILVV